MAHVGKRPSRWTLGSLLLAAAIAVSVGWRVWTASQDQTAEPPAASGAAKPSSRIAPRILYLIACAASELPPLERIAGPGGRDGRLDADVILEGSPGSRESGRPMRVGHCYVLRAASGGQYRLEVGPGEPARETRALRLPREDWPWVSFTKEGARRHREARASIRFAIERPGPDAVKDVLFAKRLVERLTDLAEGCAEDVIADLYFIGESWRVQDRDGEVDAREHIRVEHILEADGTVWLHSHGLAKFGRPEFEIFDLAQEDRIRATIGMFEVAQYVIQGTDMKAGQTFGDPSVPIHLREGTRERDHWRDTPVLEWVDLDADRRPVAMGAPRGLAAWLKK